MRRLLNQNDWAPSHHDIVVFTCRSRAVHSTSTSSAEGRLRHGCRASASEALLWMPRSEDADERAPARQRQHSPARWRIRCRDQTGSQRRKSAGFADFRRTGFRSNAALRAKADGRTDRPDPHLDRSRGALAGCRQHSSLATHVFKGRIALGVPADPRSPALRRFRTPAGFAIRSTLSFWHASNGRKSSHPPRRRALCCCAA